MPEPIVWIANAHGSLYIGLPPPPKMVDPPLAAEATPLGKPVLFDVIAPLYGLYFMILPGEVEVAAVIVIKFALNPALASAPGTSLVPYEYVIADGAVSPDSSGLSQ